ncbi:MAG: heavy metal translocating P-type ATPase [Treponema sp.]|nr:heavy metal translocating P-type ATPase [Treponema sp.]
MDKYHVSGMSCAACVARVEKAVNKVPGVKSCSVSLLTNSMGVEGSAKTEDIIKAVTNAGYGAKKMGSQEEKTASSSIAEKEEMLRDRETPLLKKRLLSSIGILLLLMYLSMGHNMWGWPLPAWFSQGGQNYMAIGMLEMILAAIVMFINKKFFISGFKSLIHGAPNMDTLVAMGSGVSFVYSLVMLFGMSNAFINGQSDKAMHFIHNLYFESAAMIVTLITVGKLLESISKGRTTNALKSLMKLAPKTANILRDNQEVNVSIEEVHIDDIFVVRPGENIPVDGVIIEGNTAINESALTGESIPVDKDVGDLVSAATLNQSGFIKCKATRVGQDTTLSQIIQMVSDAAATKAPIAKIADKVAGVFVPAVMIVAAITFVIWLLVGAEFSFSLSRGIAVLVVSCPCALGLATPVAIMVGNGMGARKGILFKTSAAIEESGRTQIVLLDKTGTITKGQPLVTDIISNKISDKEFLQLAASLEAKSEHPLSKAIMLKAQEEQIEVKDVSDFKALAGNGLTATLQGKSLAGGNLNFIEGITSNLDDEFRKKAQALAEEGKTPLFFALEKELLGIIAVADVIKDDSPRAIKELQDMGIHVVMLTGDNERTAQAIGKKAGVNQVIAGVLPDEKEKVVSAFKQYGKVCMVGDGINDAPALTSADTGMAIGAGTDVAIDAANVVLMKSRLSDVSAAIRLSRQTVKNIKENLFWAFFYNIILIPIAAGAYYHWLSLDMKPMLGAAAMSLSSFCVVTNALRLNLFKMNSPKRDKKIKQNFTGSIPLPVEGIANSNTRKEANNMAEKTLKVEGMMCQHCERHVKEALEKIDGVDSAVANHETNSVLVQLSKDVAEADFEKAVTDAGYTYVK